MVEFIKNWAQGIIIAVIIATILEMLLHNNKNKKYIGTVIGVYILFTIISPIISKFTGKNINLSDYFDTKSVATNYTMENVALLESNSNVEDIYIKTLKDEITGKLVAKGYEVRFIDLKINMNKDKNYGEILGIYLNLRIKDEKSISNVERVKINISGEKKQDLSKTNISAGEENVIKEYLMDTYGIEKKKIHINE